MNSESFDEGLPLTCFRIVIVYCRAKLSLTNFFAFVLIVRVMKFGQADAKDWEKVLLAIINDEDL